MGSLWDVSVLWEAPYYHLWRRLRGRELTRTLLTYTLLHVLTHVRIQARVMTEWRPRPSRLRSRRAFGPPTPSRPTSCVRSLGTTLRSWTRSQCAAMTRMARSCLRHAPLSERTVAWHTTFVENKSIDCCTWTSPLLGGPSPTEDRWACSPRTLSACGCPTMTCPVTPRPRTTTTLSKLCY
jgi:hypothetical protein